MSAKPLPYSHKGDLTTGPVHGHLMRLSVPMIWSIFAVIAVQVTNTWFISQLGTTELAAISYTFPVTMMVSNLTFGFNIALSSVVSRLIGEKRVDDVRRVTLHGIFLALCVSAIVSISCYFALDPIFRAFGANETVLPYIRSYMPLWLFASVVLTIPINGNSAIRASGDSLHPALLMITMAILNFMMDPVLIYGWFGVPRLGVFGGAVSTTIAYTYALILGLYLLIWRKKMISLDSLHLDTFKDSVRRLIFIAIPAGIANVVQPAAAAVITALMAYYGNEAVAAYGVATRVEALTMLVVIALAVGMSPIVGQNWGAQRYDRVHESIKLAILFNLIWSGFVALVLGIFAAPIAAAFSQDPAVIHDACLYFWIIPFSYGVSNLVFGWSSAFNAMGLPQRSFIIIVGRAVLMIAAAWIGGRLYGVPGIFWGVTLNNIITGLATQIICDRLMHGMEDKNTGNKNDDSLAVEKPVNAVAN